MQFEALFIDTLSAVLRSVGLSPSQGSSLSYATAFLDTSAKTSPGRAKVLSSTKLQKDELDALRAEIKRYIDYTESAKLERSATTARNEILSLLRALSWFDTVRNRPGCLVLPTADQAAEDHTSAFKMLRALELMMRALLREEYGDTSRIIERLREVLPSDYQDAVRRNQADPLSGLFLKDLIKVFVDESEWSKIEPCYMETTFLSLLRIKRETAEKFLEDLRRIRNSVAHLHTLSAVQVALLNHYYEELVQPVKDSFAAGRTKVDPAKFESPAELDLRDYCKTVIDEIRAESRSTKRWLFVSIGLSVLLLAALAPVVIPYVRLKLDPDVAYLYALEQNPNEHGSLAVQACERQRPAALDRLTELPHAASALKGGDAPQLNARIMRVAATDPEHLVSCIQNFQHMGWNPNQVSGNTVGSHFGSDTGRAGAAPAGYQSYLVAHAAGFGPGPLAAATELRCNVLMYAVWHANQALITKLIAAGAKPTASCLLDGIALARTTDVPVLDAFTEAKRIGNKAIVDSLESALHKH